MRRWQTALLLGMVGFLVLVQALFSSSGPGNVSRLYTLDSSSLSSAYNELVRMGILPHGGVYRAAFYLAIEAHGGVIYKGTYAFGLRPSLYQVASALAEGRVLERHITIPEGTSSLQLRALLLDTPGLRGVLPKKLREGIYYPATYFFPYGSTRIVLLRRMSARMREEVQHVWKSCGHAHSPIRTKKQGIILASIVQMEASSPASMPKVAAVFINRLRRHMPLQADATVVYGMTRGRALTRPLRGRDIRRPSPYNTYFRRGLPPGPISNPGRVALMASMCPHIRTEALYFISNGMGNEIFAMNFRGHRRNIAEWLK